MTEDELVEMIDLYITNELPDALRANFEAYLAAHPAAARDAATLRATVTHLQSTSLERPDAWFTERLLDSLLREHTAAQAPLPAAADAF